MQTEPAAMILSCQDLLGSFFQENLFECPSCKEPYDLELHVQKILPCQHYLCLQCLKNSFLMKSLQEPQCPSCKASFSSTSKTPEDFPNNQGVIEFLQNQEKAKPGYCQEHGSRQKVFCITDQVPICRDCQEYGNHKGHHVQLIKVLQDQAIKKSNKLKELLRENRQKEQRAEQEIGDKRIKMQELVTERFLEMDEILQAKKAEIYQHIESIMKTESEALIETYKKNRAQLESKIAETTKEINQSKYGFKTKEDSIDDNENSDTSSEGNIRLDEILIESEETLSRFLHVFHSLKFESMQRNEVSTQTIQETLPAQRVERKPKVFQQIPQYKKKLRKSCPKRQELIKIKTEAESPLNFQNNNHGMEEEEEFEENNNQLTEKDIQDMKNQIFMEIEAEPQLKLDFSDKDISEEIFDNLFSEKFWDRIEKNKIFHLEVDFSASSLNDQQFIKFVQNLMVHLENLTSIMIKLAKTKISSEGFQVLTQLLKNYKLRNFVLDCSQTSINDKCLKSLDDGLSSSIQTLENIEIILGLTSIQGEKFLDVLSALGQLKHLKLSFENSQISSEIVSSVVFCLSFLAQNLESLHLNFNGTEIEDEGLESFSSHAVFHLEKLRSFGLSLGGTFVSDDFLMDFFQSLNPLAHRFEIFELDLHSTRLTNVAFKHFCEEALSQMINLEHLKLDLSQTKITDASLRNMELPVRQLESLTLNLNETNLSDSSLQILKENNNLENIENLHISFEQPQKSKNVLLNSTLKKRFLKPTPNSKNLQAEYDSDAENRPVSNHKLKPRKSTKNTILLDTFAKKQILFELKKIILRENGQKLDPAKLKYSRLRHLIQNMELQKYYRILKQVLIQNLSNSTSIVQNLAQCKKEIGIWINSFARFDHSSSVKTNKFVIINNNNRSSLKIPPRTNEIYSNSKECERVFSRNWLLKYGQKISFPEKVIEILKNMSTRSWVILYDEVLEFVKELSKEYKSWKMPSKPQTFWWYDFLLKEKEVNDLWKNLPREVLKEKFCQ